MNAAIRARGVSCHLGGREVVSAVDLDVSPGRVLALVGPNGAGKSTLLGALAGDVAAEGTIVVGDRPLAEWKPRELARHRGVLMQSNAVAFAFTVREVVEMGRSPWLGRSTADEDAQAVEAAITATDIGHLVDRTYLQLSGGERARVSLARVLAQDTPVVMLDEPTAALDLRHQEDVMRVARGLAAAGKAVVVVLHDLSLAAAWADEVAMLAGGRLVTHGAPAEVLTAARVEEVYGVAVHVMTDPDGTLLVVPRRARGI